MVYNPSCQPDRNDKAVKGVSQMNKQTGRIRADELLADNPLVGSRAKAKALIMAGKENIL